MKMEYKKPQMKVSQVQGIFVMSDTSVVMHIEEGQSGDKPW